LQPILTLNSRGHILLKVLRDHFMLTNTCMRMEIQTMHKAVIRMLAAKKIEYDKLRSALVPRSDRNEAGFIFDSRAVASSWYGLDVMRHILPLLEPRATQSVLCGDLLGDAQRLIFEILNESMVLSKSFVFQHADLLFCVYLNNLSEAALRRIHQQLAAFPAYLGHIPTTFSSRAKTYLSTSLANAFLKHGKLIVMGHEDDRSEQDNVNLLNYPFEEFGYAVLSVQSTYFDIFLSFKIERPVFEGYEIDSEMSLNSISDEVLPLKDFAVVLEQAKHDYLFTDKLGKLQKAGLANLDRDRIASLIKSKVAANYIYNMMYLTDHDVMKFNLMIEMEREDGGYPTRLMAALEYIPANKTLRVITLY